MASVIAKRLPVHIRDETAPPAMKLVGIWAGLKAIPMIGFCGLLVSQGLAAESLNVFGILLMAVTALVALGYAAWALVTGYSLWHLSMAGVRGVVALAALSAAMNLFFVGTNNTIWLLAFVPELAPLVYLGIAEGFPVVTWALGTVINVGALVYVFSNRKDFM